MASFWATHFSQSLQRPWKATSWFRLAWYQMLSRAGSTTLSTSMRRTCDGKSVP